MSTFSSIQYETKNRIVFITLNRPEKRNALNFETITELKEAFSQAEKDDQVKVIILKGEGKAFCSGADLESLQKMQEFSFNENLADSTHLKELFLKIYTLPKIVIAQINGHALAGGCGLATICDFSFAIPEAKFGYTEVKIGFIPAIVSLFLIRKIGEGKAKELLLSGNLLTAEQAKEYGLINKVIEEKNLANEVELFAQSLIKNNSGQSMGFTKTMIAQVQDMELADALTYLAQLNAKARESEDCKKGVNAFLNKQELTW